MNLPLTPIRFLLRAADEYGQKVGVVDGDQRLTYSQVLGRTRRLAGCLEGLGIQPGDRVASLSFNCRQLLELYYGVPMARGVLLSLNVRLAPEEQAYILEHSGSKVVFFDPEFLPVVEDLRKRLPQLRWVSLSGAPTEGDWLHDRDYEELLAAAQPYAVDFTEYDENATAELFYTSGSTGQPKGVMLSHRTLYLHAMGVLVSHLRLPNQSQGDRRVELHTVPLFHANGWGRPHTVTALGGRHVMLKRFEPAKVCELVEQETVTTFSMVPTMAASLVHFEGLGDFDLSSLEEVNIGGAASSPTLIAEVERALGCPGYAGYGLTESGPVATTAHLKDGLGEGSEAERFRRQSMTGWTLVGTELRVVDSEGVDVPQDGLTIGEVWLRGDAVMEGYWNEPEATAEVMESDGWLHSGDMGVWDEQRYLQIVDRKKDIIISGGENISSIEVEKVLSRHPAVYECAVIGVPDERWGETPKAIVALKDGAQANEDELREHVREQLAGFKVPSSVEFMDELPKGATGKILKRVLREPYWSGHERQVQGIGEEA